MRLSTIYQYLSHKRRLSISALFLVLFCLVLYGYRSKDPVDLRACLDDPLKYDGRIIGVGAEATMFKLLPDGFLIREMGRTFRVVGDPQDASVGDFVVMRAIFHKEGYLELVKLRVAKKRRLKILVSIPPALLVLFLLFWNYRFDWRRMLFKERT